MKTLLIVYHSMTGGTRQMAEAAAAGAGSEAPAVQVALLHATQAGPADVLAADGYLFATPENLAAMSGLMKDFRLAPEGGGRAADRVHAGPDARADPAREADRTRRPGALRRTGRGAGGRPEPGCVLSMGTGARPAVYNRRTGLQSGSFLKSASDSSCGSASRRQLCHSRPAAAGRALTTPPGAICSMNA